ncbi:helix-turn-helix domain-containing protein [Edwardsiella piscicida]|uniref:helix-turn-helix domain-containing protein n=1 Tax=Edwardsiella TaxID=635 RepID=UPI0008FF7CCF|nr:helix-turn-helix domain-containing protein [Edwardsiella anguillarum]ELM3660016.1 helix-turn-helix domain-containing protein [Edwardsiella piscicida]
MDNQILTTRQAAERLQVSARTVAKLISCGRLAGKKAGHGYRTTTAALLAYIESGEETKPANAGDQTEDKPCQSSSEMAFGTVISLRQVDNELENLLGRGTKGRRKSCTTS